MGTKANANTAKKSKTEIADKNLLFIFAKSRFETNKLSMANAKGRVDHPARSVREDLLIFDVYQSVLKVRILLHPYSEWKSENKNIIVLVIKKEILSCQAFLTE